MWLIPSEKKRLKREQALLQEFCPHQWTVVSEYRSWEQGSFEQRYDMYCPVCDKFLKERDHIVKDRLLNIVKVREAYQKNIHT